MDSKCTNKTQKTQKSNCSESNMNMNRTEFAQEYNIDANKTNKKSNCNKMNKSN